MRMHYNKSDVKSWSCMKIRRNLDFWPEKMFVWVEKVHSLCPIVIWQSSFHLALHWFWKTTHSFVLDWRFKLFFVGFLYWTEDSRCFLWVFLYWTEDSRCFLRGFCIGLKIHGYRVALTLHFSLCFVSCTDTDLIRPSRYLLWCFLLLLLLNFGYTKATTVRWAATKMTGRRGGKGEGCGKSDSTGQGPVQMKRTKRIRSDPSLSLTPWQCNVVEDKCADDHWNISSDECYKCK